jgi:hypothetical protein
MCPETYNGSEQRLVNCEKKRLKSTPTSMVGRAGPCPKAQSRASFDSRNKNDSGLSSLDSAALQPVKRGAVLSHCSRKELNIQCASILLVVLSCGSASTMTIVGHEPGNARGPGCVFFRWSVVDAARSLILGSLFQRLVMSYLGCTMSSDDFLVGCCYLLLGFLAFS